MNHYRRYLIMMREYKPFIFKIRAQDFTLYTNEVYKRGEVTYDWNYDLLIEETGAMYKNVKKDLRIKLPKYGLYTIKIWGDFPYFWAPEHKDNIESIEQWGDIKWESFHSSFSHANRLKLNAVDAPDLERVKSCYTMFLNCRLLNSYINHWDMSKVESIYAMFSGCSSFNQDLNKWDVSNIHDMRELFSHCPKFNGDITSWNTDKLNRTTFMFRNCTSFNRDIGNWNTSKLVNAEYMFENALSFNQDLSGWDVNRFKYKPLGFDDGTLSWTLPKPNWKVNKSMVKGGVLV